LDRAKGAKLTADQLDPKLASIERDKRVGKPMIMKVIVEGLD
jgi:hypothetical protein